ncbi:hypothetical protein N7G274_007513 [Stereocaulon virgatum]|uniref:Uncharacterized protein n=1 Tax=Stereocaulon virgatum TaxID=373712 RepID=A0ABR4A2C5_9LECA
MLKPEVEIHRIVTYKYERRLLKRIADYILNYVEKDPYATNLVIIAAKKYGAAGLAEGQLLAYTGKEIWMSRLLECQLTNAGMVHQARKDQGKQNITNFGVASGSEAFRYHRIDNESQLVRSPPFD